MSILTDGSRPGGVQQPQPIVLSQTYIAVQWEPVSLPNGPNIRYSLTRLKIRQPLAGWSSDMDPIGQFMLFILSLLLNDWFILQCILPILISYPVSPADIGLWTEVYTGSLLYYEDRGVTVYTTYIYRLTAYNDFGFIISGNSSAVITHGGPPFEAPVLTVTTINHTSLKADWTVPGT